MKFPVSNPPAGFTGRWSAARLAVWLLIISAGGAQAAPASWPETGFSLQVARAVEKSVGPVLQERGFRWGAPAFIRLFKETNELELWLKKAGQYQLFEIYDICGLSGGLGPKLAEGDLQAPEGFYFVTPERLNPWSSYHLSMNMGYPNAYDRAHRRSGSALMVHGTCLSLGCFAIGNGAIEELYSLVDAALRNNAGFVRVHSFPFRMTAERLAEAQGSEWHSFWTNLKTGYDWFERYQLPPNTTVAAKRYVFGPGR